MKSVYEAITWGEEPEVVLDPKEKFMKEEKRRKTFGDRKKEIEKCKNWPECELASSECQEPEDEMCTLYSESPTVWNKRDGFKTEWMNCQQK